MLTVLGQWPKIALLAVGMFLTANTNGRADDKENPLRAELLKLNTVSSDDAQAAKLRALVKDKEKGKKTIAEAAKMMKEAKDKENPFTLNGAIILGRAAHILREYDTAEKLYEQQIELATKLNSGSKIVQAHENLIDLYWDAKKYADLVEACEKFMDLSEPKEVDDAKPFILERLVQAKAKQGKFDEAQALTKNLIDATNGDWYFLQLKGWVQRENGKLDDAIGTYNDVLDKLDTTKTVKGEAKDKLKDRVRYTLSGLYVENKDIEKATKQLQTLVKRNPDSATYKNDLAFIWSDSNLNLEESEKLIKEALELDKKAQEKLKADGKTDEVKDNAAYLDTLGWILFKQKKYKEALDPLKKAAADEDEGNHLEIWDHLADCHLALGDKKAAVAAWEKALKLEDVSKRDGERRRKVSEKLKKVRAELAKD